MFHENVRSTKGGRKVVFKLNFFVEALNAENFQLTLKVMRCENWKQLQEMQFRKYSEYVKCA